MEPNLMKRHLTMSLLKKGESKTNNTQRKSKNYLAQLSAYCTCQKSFFKEDTKKDQENFMIMCANCEEWYHKKCKKANSRSFKEEESSYLEIYICM